MKNIDKNDPEKKNQIEEKKLQEKKNENAKFPEEHEEHRSDEIRMKPQPLDEKEEEK